MQAGVPPTRRQALTAETLRDLGRERIRRLVHILISETGSTVIGGQRRDDLDDLRVGAAVVWTSAQSRVRLLHRPAHRRDAIELGEVVRSAGLARALLVQTTPSAENVAADAAVTIFTAEDLVDRIRASPLVAWQDGRPLPEVERLASDREISAAATALDPVGMRFLPLLALNGLPHELAGAGTPDELLERIAFRLLTCALRFGGQRLGIERRGRREPDALLTWGVGGRRTAVLDCKAARFGYRMGVDDERALTEYHARYAADAAAAGAPLSHVVVISGDFDGEPGPAHPYHQRRASIAAKTDATLVYLRAVDLSRLALALERDGAKPSAREGLAWTELFDGGMPTPEQVLSLWTGGD